MAGFKVPGVLCVLTNSVPVDDGTLARTASPSPGPTGKGPISDDDRAFVRGLRWTESDGSPTPVSRLKVLRDEHLRRKADLDRRFSAHSWQTQFEQATIDRLSELIEEAESPLGVAAERLETLLSQAQTPGGQVTDEQISKALEVILGIERQRQLTGAPGRDADGEKTGALLEKALLFGASRRASVLQKLLSDAKRPGNLVTEEEISKAVGLALGAERQMQLLGVTDPSPSRPNLMDLVVEALDISSERRKAALEGLIEKANGGGPVTDEQLSTAVQQVLGTERQRQLLGAPEDTAGRPGVTELVVRAAKVSFSRKGAALARLYDSGASEAQIASATADYENAKTQLRMLGVPVLEADVSTGPMKTGPRPANPR